MHPGCLSWLSLCGISWLSLFQGHITANMAGSSEGDTSHVQCHLLSEKPVPLYSPCHFILRLCAWEYLWVPCPLCHLHTWQWVQSGLTSGSLMRMACHLRRGKLTNNSKASICAGRLCFPVVWGRHGHSSRVCLQEGTLLIQKPCSQTLSLLLLKHQIDLYWITTYGKDTRTDCIFSRS